MPPLPQYPNEEQKLIQIWSELNNTKLAAQEDAMEPETAMSQQALRSLCEPLFGQVLTALEHGLAVALKQAAPKDQGNVLAIAAPFFDQMAAALPQAVAAMQPKEPPPVPAAQSTAVPMQQRTKLCARAPAFQPTFQVSMQVSRSPDEESTEAEENSAFTSLLSGPSASEAGSIDSESKGLDTNNVSSPQLNDAADCPDGDKSITVCRHWRSKGWCRLHETNTCKFAHPENKRGVAVPMASGRITNDDGDHSNPMKKSLSTQGTEADGGTVKQKKSRRSKRHTHKDEGIFSPCLPPGS